jgi:hypothetical protein
MPVNAQTAVQNLMNGDPHIIAAAVIEGKNNIVFSTDNWDISADVGRVIQSWNAQNAQFIMISGVKYSILQCEPERLVATSIRGEGSIVAAKDEEHKLIAYLEPDGYAPGAAMDVQRVLSSMSSKTPYIASEANLGKSSSPVASAKSSVDAHLKGEIQAFLEWVNDTNGLSGYINYYLQQSNNQIITELSKIYYELRQIFGV